MKDYGNWAMICPSPPMADALFPPLLLDIISADWAIEGGNDLLAHYILRRPNRVA